MLHLYRPKHDQDFWFEHLYMEADTTSHFHASGKINKAYKGQMLTC